MYKSQTPKQDNVANLCPERSECRGKNVSNLLQNMWWILLTIYMWKLLIGQVWHPIASEKILAKCGNAVVTLISLFCNI